MTSLNRMENITGNEHCWKIIYFLRPAYCNLCQKILFGPWKGACCIFCKYTIHKHCSQHVSNNCIKTHTEQSCASGDSGTAPHHHWVIGDYGQQCAYCQTKSYRRTADVKCRWCHTPAHCKCIENVAQECSLGKHAVHILHPERIIMQDQLTLTKSTEVTNINTPNNGNFQNVLITSSSTNSTSNTTLFRIRPSPTGCPLLVFVNPKSGGCQGKNIIEKLQYLLNPIQVYDLNKENPITCLAMFKDVQNFKVICCGGDGTINWVLAALEKSSLEKQPALGIIPLGTGNDLARCLGWGEGYEGESLHKILNKIEKAETVNMDLWDIDFISKESIIAPLQTEHNRGPVSYKAPCNIMNTSFSIGLDAKLCVQFHAEREVYPERFNSRWKNINWTYFKYAIEEFFAPSFKNLQDDVEVWCDGKQLDLSNGHRLQGLVLLNSIHTQCGACLWGKTNQQKNIQNTEESPLKYTSQEIDDGLFEIVGYKNAFHMAKIAHVPKVTAFRLAQCKTATIITKKVFPMQIDGEPWLQSPCQINVTHKRHVPMLRALPETKKKFWIF